MTANVPVCVAINTENKFFCLAAIHDASLLNTVVVNFFSFNKEGQVSLMPKIEFVSACTIVLEALFIFPLTPLLGFPTQHVLFLRCFELV